MVDLTSGLSVAILKVLQPSVQFSHSVLSDSLRRHGLSVHHELLKLAQTHILRVGGTPTISSSFDPSPPVFNHSQHQGLFK